MNEDLQCYRNVNPFFFDSISQAARRLNIRVPEEVVGYLTSVMASFHTDGGKTYQSLYTGRKDDRGLEPLTLKLQHVQASSLPDVQQLRMRNVAEACLFLLSCRYSFLKEQGKVCWYQSTGSEAYKSLTKMTPEPSIRDIYAIVAKEFERHTRVIRESKVAAFHSTDPINLLLAGTLLAAHPAENS